MKRARALAAGVACVVLAACTTGSASRAVPWRIGEEDAGKTIHVPIGTVIDVALPGNPTTGYIWQRSPGDPGGVEGIGAARFEPDGAAIGQGGLVHVEFRVTKTGATALWLVYSRPFEKGVPPVKTFSVTVVGEPD